MMHPPVFSAADHAHMAEAMALAARGRYSTHPNPRVGCVVVARGRVIGRGFHVRAGEPHAEVHALREAGPLPPGCTVYVTLEPCAHHGRTPPCADALADAGPARVVVAGLDPNPLVAGQGVTRLRAAGITVDVGLLRAEAEALNPGFLRRIAGGLPWLRLKLAASLDGRTGMASGESKWITGPAARRDVQRWRAASSVVLTGIGTVLADDPALNVRPEDWCDPAALTPVQVGAPAAATASVRQPRRVVLDSQLRLPLTAALLRTPGEVSVVSIGPAQTLADAEALAWLHAHDAIRAARAEALMAAGVSLQLVPATAGQPDLKAALQALAAQGCNEVLVEAGATLAGACLRAGLVDEVLLYQAPTLLGSSGRPLADWPMTRMAEQQRLQLADLRQLGDDVRLTLRPVKA